MLTKKKKLLFSSIMLVLMLVVIEGISLIACLFLQSKGVIYQPHLNKEFSQYIATRENILGWPNTDQFGHDSLHDISGSRIIPSFIDPSKNKTYISLYGDSFTWGDHVDHAHTWGNILSSMIQARVANYGVSGYGSDQAYLRFLQNTGDEANIVFLNHLSENIIRNINQYRQLLYPGEGLSFKPRFIIQQNGSLKLISTPTFSEKEYPDVVYHPERYLPYEYFVPKGPSGIQELSFPYTCTFLKCFRNFHIKAKLRRVSWYAEFYDPDHPSQALNITIGILKQFYHTSLARGKTPIITVIPDEPDLVFFRKNGCWPYQSLIDGLKNQSIEVLNFGDGIMQQLGSDDAKILFVSSHYNEAGNRILANIAFEYLKEKELILPQTTRPNAKVDVRKPRHRTLLTKLIKG